MKGERDYCREIEDYLCRKNDGHLIRIVGPSFEKVCGWAEQGVPITVAFRGIDRCFERYYAKGPRRRPVRIDFCEADVLDVFDEWRRAVGVPAAAVDPEGDEARAALRREAEAELQPFRARMPQDAFEQSLAACADRLLRERARLPVLAFE